MFRHPGNGYGYRDDGLSIAAFVVHTIFWAVILAVAVYVILRVLRSLTHTADGRPRPLRPFGGRPASLTELDLRYARGDIQRDDYLQRRADLLAVMGLTPTPPPSWSPYPQGYNPAGPGGGVMPAGAPGVGQPAFPTPAPGPIAPPPAPRADPPVPPLPGA